MTKDNIIDINYCNICDKEFDNYVLDDVKEHYCPYCNSQSGERLFYQQIQNHITNARNLLLINPTKMLESRIKEDNINLFTTSNNPKLDYEDEFFDIILADHVLDKTTEDMLMLDEINRVLKKDGILLIRENIDLELENTIDDDFIAEKNYLRQKFFGNNDALRCYGRNFLTILKNKGFEVTFHNPDSQKENILLKTQLIKDPLFCCKKKNHYNNIVLDQKEYDSIKEEIEILKENNQKLSNTLNEVFTSNSWKILSPLRSLRRKIK